MSPAGGDDLKRKPLGGAGAGNRIVGSVFVRGQPFKMAARECSSRSRSRILRCHRSTLGQCVAGTGRGARLRGMLQLEETGRLDPGRRDTAAVFALHLVSRAPVSRARSAATMLVSVPGGGGSSETATTGRWARMRATSRTAVLAGRGLFGDPG